MTATALGNRKRRLGDDPMMPVPKKDGAGRKSLYKAEYCSIAEQMGKQGKSVSQIATIFNVDRKSLQRWAEEHEEFALSLARAKTSEQAWWEAKAQQKLGAKHFQAQLWRHSMTGRFEDYREARQINGLDALPDFLAAISEAADRRKAALAKPGDDAKAINTLDVVPEPDK